MRPFFHGITAAFALGFACYIPTSSAAPETDGLAKSFHETKQAQERQERCRAGEKIYCTDALDGGPKGNPAAGGAVHGDQLGRETHTAAPAYQKAKPSQPSSQNIHHSGDTPTGGNNGISKEDTARLSESMSAMERRRKCAQGQAMYCDGGASGAQTPKPTAGGAVHKDQMTKQTHTANPTYRDVEVKNPGLEAMFGGSNKPSGPRLNDDGVEKMSDMHEENERRRKCEQGQKIYCDEALKSREEQRGTAVNRSQLEQRDPIGKRDIGTGAKTEE